MEFRKSVKKVSRNTDVYTYDFGDRITVCISYIQAWANVNNCSEVIVTRYRKGFSERYEWKFDSSFTPEAIENLISTIERELKKTRYYDEYAMVDALKKIYCRPPRRLVEVVR